MSTFFICLLMGSFTLITGSSIENTRAIVTGGANGIGKAYAHYLLLKGAKVVAILDKDLKNGTVTTKKLNDQFGENRAVLFLTDVSKPDMFEASFKEAVKYLGGLDLVINNAGIMDDSKWSLEMDTNVKGIIQGTLMAFNVMGKHKGGNGGTVINIGSIGSFMVCQYIPIYCATKYAILGFTRGIALNYEQTGVSVKLMCPGATRTFLMTNPAPRYLNFLDQEKAFEWLQSLPIQEPEAVAKEMMRLIEDAPNGAIWVPVLNTPTLSLDIPEYPEWGTPV